MSSARSMRRFREIYPFEGPSFSHEGLELCAGDRGAVRSCKCTCRSACCGGEEGSTGDDAGRREDSDGAGPGWLVVDAERRVELAMVGAYLPCHAGEKVNINSLEAAAAPQAHRLLREKLQDYTYTLALAAAGWGWISRSRRAVLRRWLREDAAAAWPE